MEIRAVRPGDAAALAAFLRRIPEGDRTFFKEDVEDPGVVAGWVQDGEGRWLATVQDAVVGYVSVVALHGWSSHVGEIRLIVDPAHRGHGVGRALAQHAVLAAFRAGFTKLVVEVLATQEFTIAMFRALGFDPEALLTGQVRDRGGELRDLMILAHAAGDAAAAMATAGLFE
ncbi:MAG TPA: GNAT family N-acetyltransferase [Solirubrobacteraceae bacterium]|nr:GNAT family N-acetyltransferase [Solirubrobacteraceae bacterium]